MDGFAERQYKDSGATVWRNGDHPRRQTQAVIGALELTVPKVRGNDGAGHFLLSFISRYLSKARILEVELPWRSLNKDWIRKCHHERQI